MIRGTTSCPVSCVLALRSRYEKAAAPPAHAVPGCLQGWKENNQKIYLMTSHFYDVNGSGQEDTSSPRVCIAQCFSRVWSNSETNKWCHHMYFSFFFFLWSWFDVHLNGGWKLWFIPLLVVFHFAERRGIPFEAYVTDDGGLFFMGPITRSKQVSKK